MDFCLKCNNFLPKLFLQQDHGRCFSPFEQIVLLASCVFSCTESTKLLISLSSWEYSFRKSTMHFNFCHFFFSNSVWTFIDIVRSPYSHTRAWRMDLEEHHTLTTAVQKLGCGTVERRWMVRALQVHHSVICRQVVLSYCILQVWVFENEHVKEQKYHNLVSYIALHLYHVLHKWAAFMDQQCIIQYSNRPY